MLLIDSLYINSSGGLQLLLYLVKELKRREIPFLLLSDDRCAGVFDVCGAKYLKASHHVRKMFYERNINKYSSVLCFGNVPPPEKLEIPVYTYFHNINLLTLTNLPTWKEKILGFIKREYLRHYKKNTNLWLVQTTNTRTELLKHFNESGKRVMILPFYEIPESITNVKKCIHGDDYVFVAYYSGAKGHDILLNAWIMLHKKGFRKRLHLTVNDNHPAFLDKIKKAQDMGVNIVNHGQVPFEKVCELYKLAKAIVYPSLNESLGLGVVEAIHAGCDVLGSDLPFIHSICRPSVVFNPKSVDSIVNAIMEYENGLCMKSELKITNNIENIIKLIK